MLVNVSLDKNYSKNCTNSTSMYCYILSWILQIIGDVSGDLPSSCYNSSKHMTTECNNNIIR